LTAVIENTSEISRSPEDVFDYLSDMGHEVEWNPDCVSMERLTEGPVGVGTRFRAKWKQGPVVITECTNFERPRTWTYLNGGPISVLLTVTLEPTSDGRTLLTSRGEWTPHGAMRLAFPIFVRVMRRAELGVMANSRRFLEERRDRSADS
jgi:uncharacterized protein YndB with AHSA1/START domain